MKKEELKNWLLVKNENWSFYVKDSERKRIFVELLEDGFPSAIQLYFQAPRQFVEKYQEFQKVHFQYISELYFPMKYLPDGTMEEPKKTKEKQLQSYAETVKRIREEKQEGAIEFLKAELWAKCIDSLLDMCESYHNKRIKESKEDEKIFHQNCKENIKAMKEKRKQEREQAIAYFKNGIWNRFGLPCFREKQRKNRKN